MIQFGYPEFIEIDGIPYAINTSFKYGLLCFDCVNDNEISDVERGYALIGILFKDEPLDEAKALSALSKYLRCGVSERTGTFSSQSCEKKPDMDYVYDFKYIKASFMSDYHMDLDFVDMHWWKFCTLVMGLRDSCILNKIRDIRNYDLNTIKDAKSREKMRKAQEDFALPQIVSLEEKLAIEEFESLFE